MKRTTIQSVLGISRPAKRVIALSVDILLCAVSVWIAYYLRLGEWSWLTGVQWISLAASILFAVPLFITFGLYRAIFRYAGWAALMAVSRAMVIYGLIYSTVFTFVGVTTIPRTIGLIQPILLFIAIGASRAIARYWLGGGYEALVRLTHRPKVLIYGAGAAGRQLAAAMANNETMNVVGFIDDDTTLQGSILNGKRIYSSENLSSLLAVLGISDILLAIPSASRRRRNEILEKVRGMGAAIRTLPGMMDLAQGRVTINDLHELDIEDLLGRDAVAPNQILLGKNITDKIVLVSGAGGSIGSELCRQILHLSPRVLLLVEMSEFGLYTVHQELEKSLANDRNLTTRVIPLLASVADKNRINAIMEAWAPNTVYHAAAYKHVPLVEHNPVEGIRNNVLGTLFMAQAAMAYGVDDFVLISTDKAVRPTNIMGASKRLAEMVLQAMAERPRGVTRFCMVRFGNVLGSSGSVVPLFRQQIRNGDPITITHEEITRYFMTIPEAAQLVIQAGAMASGGEVFVLDMGDPVKIVDLARKIVELSGLKVRDGENPDGDIEISFVGLRPGEKLYEELLIGNNPIATGHPRIMKANESFFPWAHLNREIAALTDFVNGNDVQMLRDKLGELVPEYAWQGELVDWLLLARSSEGNERDRAA